MTTIKHTPISTRVPTTPDEVQKYLRPIRAREKCYRIGRILNGNSFGSITEIIPLIEALLTSFFKGTDFLIYKDEEDSHLYKEGDYIVIFIIVGKPPTAVSYHTFGALYLTTDNTIILQI